MGSVMVVMQLRVPDNTKHVVNVCERCFHLVKLKP